MAKTGVTTRASMQQVRYKHSIADKLEEEITKQENRPDKNGALAWQQLRRTQQKESGLTNWKMKMIHKPLTMLQI
jgi:hypothetical protein